MRVVSVGSGQERLSGVVISETDGRLSRISGNYFINEFTLYVFLHMQWSGQLALYSSSVILHDIRVHDQIVGLHDGIETNRLSEAAMQTNGWQPVKWLERGSFETPKMTYSTSCVLLNCTIKIDDIIALNADLIVKVNHNSLNFSMFIPFSHCESNMNWRMNMWISTHTATSKIS